MADTELTVRGVDLNKIRNRNEKRVAKFMVEILDQYYEDYLFEQLDLEDIYALTLNLLPARYVQRGSIILSDRLSDSLPPDPCRDPGWEVRKVRVPGAARGSSSTRRLPTRGFGLLVATTQSGLYRFPGFSMGMANMRSAGMTKMVNTVDSARPPSTTEPRPR